MSQDRHFAVVLRHFGYQLTLRARSLTGCTYMYLHECYPSAIGLSSPHTYPIWRIYLFEKYPNLRNLVSSSVALRISPYEWPSSIASKPRIRTSQHSCEFEHDWARDAKTTLSIHLLRRACSKNAGVTRDWAWDDEAESPGTCFASLATTQSNVRLPCYGIFAPGIARRHFFELLAHVYVLGSRMRVWRKRREGRTHWLKHRWLHCFHRLSGVGNSLSLGQLGL